VLLAGLDGAVRDGLLARNPAVLKAAVVSRYYRALVLIAATGLRKGEALGLCWDVVEPRQRHPASGATLNRVGRALVSTEPKTERSRRTVPLSPAVVVMLRKHRAAQTGFLIASRGQRGRKYEEIPRPAGSPLGNSMACN
jgi:integrase